MLKNKCIDCTERVLGCHSKCSDYQEFRNQIDTLNQNIKSAQNKSVSCLLMTHHAKILKCHKK